MIKYFLLSCLFVISACKQDNSGFWKACGENNIDGLGDFLAARANYEVGNTLLDKQKQPIATVTDIESRWLIGDKIMHLKSHSGEQTARYCLK